MLGNRGDEVTIAKDRNKIAELLDAFCIFQHCKADEKSTRWLSWNGMSNYIYEMHATVF